jgi:hypothetical protein
MMSVRRFILGAALLAMPAVASAQNPYFRGTGGNIVTTTGGPAVPFTRSFQPNPYIAPPINNGFNGFGFGAYIPAGGAYLSGAADVMNAQGNFLNQRQNALMARQKVKQEELNTRRMQFDQRQYELANTPSGNQVREANRQLMLERAMSAPPETEIASGFALNTLLTNIQLISPSGVAGPNVPLPSSVIGHLNVEAPSLSGRRTSTAMLKNGGRLDWPLALRGRDFATFRTRIDADMATAVEQFTAGTLEPEIVKQLTTNSNALNAKVRSMAAEMDGPDFIQSRQFLSRLDSSIAGLRDPALVPAVAASKLKGGTVSEVVGFMTQNGLRFAPAGQEDLGSYFAMHQAMVSYNVMLMNAQQAMMAQPTPTPKQ